MGWTKWPRDPHQTFGLPERGWRPGRALTRVWPGPLTGHCSVLAVSLELGDVSLVSVPPEGLQPAPDRGSQGQLIAQLQELLHHWVLWSAVKSRWVIVGKWAPPTLIPSVLQLLPSV